MCNECHEQVTPWAVQQSSLVSVPGFKMNWQAAVEAKSRSEGQETAFLLRQ